MSSTTDCLLEVMIKILAKFSPLGMICQNILNFFMLFLQSAQEQKDDRFVRTFLAAEEQWLFLPF